MFRKGKECQCKSTETRWYVKRKQNEIVSVIVQHCQTKTRLTQKPYKKHVPYSRGSNQVIVIFSSMKGSLALNNSSVLKYLTYNQKSHSSQSRRLESDAVVCVKEEDRWRAYWDVLCCPPNHSPHADVCLERFPSYLFLVSGGCILLLKDLHDLWAAQNSSQQHRGKSLLQPEDHICHSIGTQIMLVVHGGTCWFHGVCLSSLKVDWTVHLYLSNWPKPSGMHSSTSLCKCLSFLTPTTFHKIFSPATPLPTCRLLSQLCWAPFSAVNRVAPHSPLSCTPLERTPHHCRSAAL